MDTSAMGVRVRVPVGPPSGVTAGLALVQVPVRAQGRAAATASALVQVLEQVATSSLPVQAGTVTAMEAQQVPSVAREASLPRPARIAWLSAMSMRR
ncbi:hypothetical protein KIM372_03830 [Bombiscardovia nodaiensis]|uniref:Uncharacterized protein n=1 Tax=Bombiscardovia nodaiensis TaxID=2932181 RepID=A0ABN6SCD9_9BIFI|nr:hypothetical protein KIM372_03830 [Bombiscardovia nodaiensis]